MPKASEPSARFAEVELALEKYRNNEFIGCDPRIVRQALTWVQTRDIDEVTRECGVSRETASRNMMSPLFMALVKHINEKIDQPDIIGPAWVQVQLLKLNAEVEAGEIDPEHAKLRLQTLRAMQSTLPKRSDVKQEVSAFAQGKLVSINAEDYQEV